MRSQEPLRREPVRRQNEPLRHQIGKTPGQLQALPGGPAELRAYGEKLYKDPKLSSNGLSCESCHQGGNLFQASFAKAYPHEVAMAKNQFGMSQVFLDEMVQICMVAPMATKALGWQSKELAALTAYVATLQTSFKPNPCAAKNPCAARNPCAAKNPCAGKKPCAAKCAAGTVSQ
ncbi:c-type cytochrome [Pseudomonas aeruginosa]|uniref:c-type cytochrome n=1 Tax=Pseudomonas aeruginosa TaxID=287 RepID=UPI00398E83B1